MDPAIDSREIFKAPVLSFGLCYFANWSGLPDMTKSFQPKHNVEPTQQDLCYSLAPCEAL